MYCWLKPDISANRSCVRPFLRLIRLTFRPTSFRMSMRVGHRITQFKFINCIMYNPTHCCERAYEICKVDHPYICSLLR